MAALTRFRVAVLIASLVAASLTACSSADPGAAPIEPAPTGAGQITIGVADDEPGVSIRTETGYQGFDIDTATYIAAKLGVPANNIIWKPLDAAERIGALENDQVDLVVAAFTITPERARQVSFSEPYFIAHQDLLIRRNDDTITGPRALDGKTLCAPAGTTSAEFLQANYRGQITLRKVPSTAECVRNLATGDVDVVSTDDILLAGFAAVPQYKGLLKVVGKGFTDEPYGVGVKKGDDAQVQKVNAALKSYIDSGAWKESLDRWVAPSGYKIPRPPTINSES